MESTKYTAVEEVTCSDAEGKLSPAAAREPWLTGFWRRLPWLPFLGILSTILCACACVAVLAVSDGANTEDWRVNPSVLIGIFTAVGNTSLRYALSEGFQIAWWSRATQPHSINRLHEYYTYGTSALSAGLSFRSPSLIAVASLLATIMVVDSPLLQSASTTALVVREDASAPMSMILAPQLPFGFTGMEFASDVGVVASRPLLNPSFASIFAAYNQRVPITAATAQGCLGVCDGEIEAAGLWKTCNITEEKVITPLMNETEVGRALFRRDLFVVDWKHVTEVPPMNSLHYGFARVADGMDDAVAEDEPYIRLKIDYSPLPKNGSRSIFHKTCHLYSGTSRYKIRIHNDTQETNSLLDSDVSAATKNIITLSGPSTFIEGTVQNARRAVAGLGLPLTAPGHPDAPPAPWNLTLTQPVAFFNHPKCWMDMMCPLYETLGGLASAAQDILSANVSTAYTSYGTGVNMQGALSNQLVSSLPEAGVEQEDAFVWSVGWDDPTEHIFSVLDELMFRIAVNTSAADALEKVTWVYADFMGNTIPAPARNGSDAQKYKLLPTAQPISMHRSQTIQVFRSHYGFLAGGIAVMVVAVCGVLPLFYGFWALGRSTSMSPVETARAFAAPVLDRSPSATIEGIVESEVGRVVVRYGEVVDGAGEGLRLRFERAEKVEPPVGGRVYA